MLLKSLVDEDFVNYRKPSMFLGTVACTWKCCTEAGIPISVCQNSHLANQKNIEISADEIFRRYFSNPITKAIVFGGLEPFLQILELIAVIDIIRTNGILDDIVIYTGYTEDEVSDIIKELASYPNIIVKFGRYIPGHTPHLDDVLGVKLASDNQYAIRIS